MKNYKNYLSLNLLSFIGYVFLLFCLVVIFILFPQTKEFDALHNNFDPDAQYGLFNQTYEIFILCLCIEVILFLCTLAEIIINKFYKKSRPLKIIKIPLKLKKLHSILFYSGLILAVLPFCLLIYILFA